MFANGITYLSSILWTDAEDVQVVGDYAYCAFRNGLIIFNISDPANPSFVSRFYLGGEGRGIFVKDGFVYLGEPVTPGFRSIRQKGESVSVMLVLDDGQVAYGDCSGVQYAGVCDRDPPIAAEDLDKIVENRVAGQLVGREVGSFRPLAEEFDSLQLVGRTLHTAMRYGLSQAFLDAVARARHKTMAEVVVEPAPEEGGKEALS